MKTDRLTVLTLLVAALFVASTAATGDTVSHAITRQGRNIMLDGFLPEWSRETARFWDSAGVWKWDAMATPEGVAGYLRSSSAVQCSGWMFQFTGAAPDHSADLPLLPDAATGSRFVRINRTGDDTATDCVIEWLFPWQKEQLEAVTPYTLTINGRSPAGELLPVLQITCSFREKKGSASAKLTQRLLLIGILGILYLTVRRTIKRQNRKTESPHQSA